MKTDRLIALLAARAAPVRPRRAQRRLAATLALAAVGVLLLTLALMGLRADLASAAGQAMFWWKLAFPGSLAVLAAAGLGRLGFPGTKPGLLPWAAAGVVLLAWAAGAWALLEAEPTQRSGLLMGDSPGVCVASIAALAVPAVAAAFWAERRLAPTRPVLTGAAAGLFAGACAGFAYALHCTEMQLPFVATWYTLGMLVPAVLGALAGRELLRW